MILKSKLASFLSGSWKDNSQDRLQTILLFFLGAGFLLSPEPLWADIYYIGVLPLALYLGWKNRVLLSLRTMPFMMKAATVLVLWFGITLFWDRNSIAHPAKLPLWCLNLLCTAVFIHLLHGALLKGRAFRERLTTVLLVGGFLNILVTFLRFPFYQGAMWSNGVLRMGGWAETRHPILGAVVIGIVVLLACARGLQRRQFRYGVIVLAGLIFIEMTGSRGPEIAIAVSLAVLLGLAQPKILAPLVLVGVCIGGLAVFLDGAVIHHMVAGQLERGDSHRFAIWVQSWHDIQKRPLLGYGPGYVIARSANESFPHNLFLSTWLYTGLVGLGLLVCHIVATLQQALKAPCRLTRALSLALFLEVMINAMTDFGQVIRGPSLMWYVFWLPMLLAAIPSSEGVSTS